jgi:hypothetical protein
MSDDKNFLQELQSLKHEIELIKSLYTDNHDEFDQITIDCIDIAIEHAQDMINHCIELQLALMKDERTANFYKKRDIDAE